MMNSDELKQIVKEAVSEALEQKKKSDRLDLMNLLSAYEMNSYTTTFYNPAIATFGMSISALRGSIQLYLAPPINKDVRGFAKPGEKRYDHDKNFIFGLTLSECQIIRENFDALLDGTWRRPQDPNRPPVDEKYQHIMEFQHQSRKFSIGNVKDRSSRNTLRVAIYDPDRQGSLGYILRPDSELSIFKSFIDNAITMLPFMIALTGGVVKAFKSAIYNVNANSNGNSNNSNGNYSVNNNNTSSQGNMWEEATGNVSVEEPPPWEEPVETKQPIQQPIVESFLSEQPAPVSEQPTTEHITPEEVEWNF